MCVCVCVCVCVKERVEWVCVCVCVCERESWVSVCVCVCERERVSVRTCVWEREREKESVCVCVSVHSFKPVLLSLQRMATACYTLSVWLFGASVTASWCCDDCWDWLCVWTKSAVFIVGGCIIDKSRSRSLLTDCWILVWRYELITRRVQYKMVAGFLKEKGAFKSTFYLLLLILSLPQPVKFPGWKMHLINSIFSGSVTHLLSVLCILPKILSHVSVKKKRKRLKGFRFHAFTGHFQVTS